MFSYFRVYLLIYAHDHGDNRYREVALSGGDFMWHVDDDDVAAPGAVAKIKAICRDKTTPYLFRFRYSDPLERTLTRTQKMKIFEFLLYFFMCFVFVIL